MTVTKRSLHATAMDYITAVMPSARDWAESNIDIRLTRHMPADANVVSRDRDDGRALGYFEPHDRIMHGRSVRRLWVCRGQTEYQQIVTALHEVGHWLWMRGDVHPPHMMGGQYLLRYIGEQPVPATGESWAPAEQERVVETAARHYVEAVLDLWE